MFCIVFFFLLLMCSCNSKTKTEEDIQMDYNARSQQPIDNTTNQTKPRNPVHFLFNRTK